LSAPPPEVPDQLNVARRAIDDLPALSLVQDLSFSRELNRWILCVAVTLNTATEDVPARTLWWIHIDPRYPWGTIEVYPSKMEGISATFHHQDLNLEGDSEPWRTGDICVRVPLFAVGRRQFDEDPVGRQDRLRWYFERVILWVSAAASGTLIKDDDPFELPQFKPGRGVVGFLTGDQELSWFPRKFGRAGLAEFALLRAEPLQLVVTSIRSSQSDDALQFQWGERVRDAKQHSSGFWIVTNEIPVLKPYRAPVTWADLRKVCEGQGITLDNVLKGVLGPLRDGSTLFGLIGFPIPRVFSGPNVQMHWQAFKLPAISYGENFQRGFRKSHPDAYWLRDRRSIFRSNDKISWLHSENWSPPEIGTRGQLPDAITRSAIAVLGVGAIGALFAELLVRGGARRVVVVDNDTYHVGNGSRHTLLIDDVGGFKAPKVASRLNRINPLVRVKALTASFPELKQEEWSELKNCDVIIDCSGDDDVLAALAETSFGTKKWFWSVSISFAAKRAYVYSTYGATFSANDYFSRVTPWIEQDRKENERKPVVWEGTGCWHAVFPARCDEVNLMIAAALRYLVDVHSKDLRNTSFVVFECVEKDGSFSGIRRIDDETK
jgi:hypothetical protein